MNEHGDFYIEYSHNVFYVKVLGPWNFETFEHYNNDFNKLLIGNKCPSYSVFAVLEGDSLMIPEVCETFKKRQLNALRQDLNTSHFTYLN